MVQSAGELYQAMVQQYRKTCPVPDTRPFLVAVSGGVDSMVLLHLAKRFADDSGRTVMAVHVHHGLREESDDEETFVGYHCAVLGVPLVTKHLRLAQNQGETSDNMEMLARTHRYQAFVEVSNEVGTSEVWLGHHADDQLETMLWRLVRGTSLTGLSGMRSRTNRFGLTLIRPLLQCTRAAISAYANLFSIPNVEDGSNHNLSLTRNHLRLEVIPLLRHRHPHAAEHASQLAEILQDEDDWLDETAERLLSDVSQRHDDGILLDLGRFRRVPLPLQRRLIKILLYCLGHGDWTMRHIQAVLQLANGESPSAQIQLSKSIVARRMYGALWVGTAPDNGGHVPYDVVWDPTVAPRVKGIRDSESEWLFAGTKRTYASPVTGSAWNAWIAGEGPFHIRMAMRGERVTLFGRNGTKKVQDIFVDAKVPQHVRWTWPVVADSEGIVWIPGVMRSGRRLISDEDSQGWAVHAKRFGADRLPNGKMDTCSAKPYIE